MVNKPTHNGPGRGTPRTRAVASARNRSRSPRQTRRVERPDGTQLPAATPVPRLIRGAGFTRRAIALLVVCAVLLISFGSSLRVYLRQERELAVAQQQIAERTRANAELADEIERWKNPDFVKAQARERLGWVVPGEVGYRVVDANGEPLGGGVSISSTRTLPAGEHETAWWDRLSGSIATADEPLVAPGSKEPVVTASPEPGSTPTPTPTPTKKR
ncbi:MULTISPECIES: FtsB family cell division protein [unclassified Luteococcus]|uniref:FtsB family cell division protein n=1 Tax=unclassified Luteococcus TaxID=2639923 RepID=UPI00313AEF76